MALVGYATTDASFLEEPAALRRSPEREVDMFVTHEMGVIPKICTSM
jgi:hypothetical protein